MGRREGLHIPTPIDQGRRRGGLRASGRGKAKGRDTPKYTPAP